MGCLITVCYGVIPIKNSRFTVSVYFAAFVACMIAIDSTGLTVLALLCVLIHECGHIFMLFLFHIPISKVSLRLFGINIEVKNDYALSYKKEAAVAIAGCCANLITVVVALILLHFNIFPGKCEMILLFSLIIGLINILPISSLDGASALEALLMLKFTEETAAKIINFTSALFIIPLMCCGAYIMVISPFNISLVAVSLYLIAFLLKKNGVLSVKLHTKSDFH